jgi:hypothetical protein
MARSRNQAQTRMPGGELPPMTSENSRGNRSDLAINNLSAIRMENLACHVR